MPFIPTKEELDEARKYIDKTTDDFGTAVRVKMLIEQAEKVQKIAAELENLDKSKTLDNIIKIING